MHSHRRLPAVQILRIVLVQNHLGTPDRVGRLRIRRRERAEDTGDGLPPLPIRLTSPYDTDTRWSTKRDMFWNGFELHAPETCHPQADGPSPWGEGTYMVTNFGLSRRHRSLTAVPVPHGRCGPHVSLR
jgi:hypothetical protein